jgi:predicted nucleic acid-binding protein
MSDRFFLDTNILVYSVDLNSPNKQVLANNLVRNAIESRRGVISYQVVQEFFSVAFRFQTPMELDDAERYLATTLRSLPVVHSSYALFVRALQLNRHNSLSWYDSLIVAAALEVECGILYSEDFQDQQQFGKLKVVNPFRQ